MIAQILALAIRVFFYLLTGARARWIGCGPTEHQRVYFANHASHGDFVLIWSSLPAELRRRTRPVAGADYWDRGSLRRFAARSVFRAVLVSRDSVTRGRDALELMQAALDEGDSLILFPEGTRNIGDAPLLPLKSGISHLARHAPSVEFVPVWIENIARVLPKGAWLPVPLLCSVSFGTPLRAYPDEERDAFLTRARLALLELRPHGADLEPAP